jgi:hypothetical protein
MTATDSLYTIEEDEFFREDWAERKFYRSLVQLYGAANLKASPIFILQGLLSNTEIYLQQTVLSDDPDLNQGIEALYALVADYTKQKTLKSKIDTFDNAMSIGWFIDLMIKCGMPRNAAIEATRIWLGLGFTTVRTHNEDYRKVIKSVGLSGQDTYRYVSVIQNKIKKLKPFPENHPKAKSAYKAMLETLKMYEERKRAFDLALDKVANQAK